MSSSLLNLFDSSPKIDNVSFKYDPSKQKKANQPNFPCSTQIRLFQFDSSTKENKPLGNAMFLIRPVPNQGFQIFVYQNQNNPFISQMINQTMKWTLRNKIYGYLTDSRGLQWTIQFSDASVAARASVSIASVLSPVDNDKVSVYDISIGSGNTVTKGDILNVSYIGFVGNNLPFTATQFDSNDNFNFTIGSETIIKGYSLGTDGMRIGGTRVIIMPPEFAYGSKSIPGRIPSNSTLTFLITLNNAKIVQNQENVQQKVPSKIEKLQKIGAVSIPSVQQEPERDQTKTRIEEQPKEERFDIKAENIYPTVDESELLQRMDQLTEMIRTKFESLILEAPVSMKPGDIVFEVQSLAAQIEDKERQILEQQQIIEELQKTKQSSKLKEELDIAQTELQSLHSVLKGGRDLRHENEELRSELKNLKENKLNELEHNIADLRYQLANSKDITKSVATTKTKELFFSFMGSVIDKIQNKLEGQNNLSSADVVNTLYDVFHNCSEEIFAQIEQNGIL